MPHGLSILHLRPERYNNIGRENIAARRLPRPTDMTDFDQPSLFDNDPSPREALPEGFRYQPELISAHDEQQLIQQIESLPLKEFEFQGYVGKRRVVSFGWRYDFN